MLCCRKRPPSPNEKEQRKSPPKETHKSKSKSPPPTDKPTNGHTVTNSAAVATSPEAVVLEEKAINAEAGVPRKGSPSKSPSPDKSPKKRTPSPTKSSPKKSSSSSPDKKSPSPVKESPKKASSQTRKSPEKGKSPSKSPTRQVPGSPTKVADSPADRSSAASISDYLRRLESTKNLGSLVSEGKTLLAEAKARQAAGGHDAKMSADLSNLIARLEAVTSRLENVSGSGASEEGQGAAVQAFDDVVKGPFADFFNLSNKIGGAVATQSGIVKDALDRQREFLIIASKAKKPDEGAVQNLLTPLSQKISEVQEFREQNRANRDAFNHLSVLSEAIGALGWVAVTPAPAPYVKEMMDAGQFYSNRVLKEFKEKDKTHVEWVRAWTKALTELQAFVKQHHTTGVAWNRQGVDASTLSSGSAPAAPPPPAGGPPPPPPPGPPPPPFVGDNAPAQDDGSGARNALFADLNKGTDITSGLRKVKDDQKTHKNAALRLQSPVPFKAPAASPKPKAAAVAVPAKPPKTELEGKKWIIEFHKDNKNIVLDNVNMKQQVYIYKCVGSTIQVKGKVNSIVLDNCKKTAVVFDTVVAAVEAVNCQSVQCQVTGYVPTVSVDKTDGFQMYLNEASIKSEIVTAKSSEMNILVPQANGEFKEFALPEQFKSIWNGSNFKTDTTDINA